MCCYKVHKQYVIKIKINNYKVDIFKLRTDGPWNEMLYQDLK